MDLCCCISDTMGNAICPVCSFVSLESKKGLMIDANENAPVHFNGAGSGHERSVLQDAELFGILYMHVLKFVSI
ncbi:hypothetical protein Y1Q_0002727 [Alligator mississippiensis]|uniref:Uncharacterized protein n=1 Tax=Alligator mississippiensis TaxID=8496 RepID=A0A151NZ78_ALLMI|nr:hypothetical protein Y1Q_0002727 [Alligator mississippiensis]